MNVLPGLADPLYTEEEAAEALGISIARLHALLDRYIFNQGSSRPSGIEFTSRDLLLLRYWANRGEHTARAGNVVQMRRHG